MIFTVIVEYYRADLEVPSMEIARRPSLRSAQHVARKRLKTAKSRPFYIPEVARVEDPDGKVLCVYDWDDEAGRPVMRRE